ncbi:MAG: hypothetical protein ACLS43_01165 [Evtepia gabavorous]
MVTSTNQVYASERRRAEGLALVAVTQTAGRGRRITVSSPPQIPAFT